MRESEKIQVVGEAISRYLHDHHDSLTADKIDFLQSAVLESHAKYAEVKEEEDAADEAEELQLSLDDDAGSAEGEMLSKPKNGKKNGKKKS